MNTFVFYIVLMLCYSPMFMFLILSGDSLNIFWKPELHIFATLVFMNSSVNPILYCWHLREFRTAIIKTAKTIVCSRED